MEARGPRSRGIYVDQLASVVPLEEDTYMVCNFIGNTSAPSPRERLCCRPPPLDSSPDSLEDSSESRNQDKNFLER
jgi:hypothetical protein